MTDEQETPETAPDERELVIASEQAIAQRPVPFMGDELAAASTAGGAIYITLPGICRALGLNTQAQLRRITRTPTLRRALRVITLDTRGGAQRVNCLRVDKVALWLGGIETLSVKEQYRAKIEAYQDELAPAAMQVFMRVLGVQPAPETSAAAATGAQIAELAAQLDTLLGVVGFLREHLDAQIGAVSLRLDDALALLEALGDRQTSAEHQIARIDERTQRLTPAHARSIQEQVDRLVHDTKRLAQPLTYAIVYGRLKHRFRASSYREIADEQYNAVMTFLHDELRRALAGEGDTGPAQGRLF